MIALLLSAVLLGSAPWPDEKELPPPDPEQVASTCAALKRALAADDVELLARSLRDAAEVLHPDVIALVDEGLQREEERVREAALSALRWMEHPDALAALHAAYKKDKDLRKHPELGVLLLKAIGQHASPRSIAVLADDPFGTPGEKALQARIFGLGRIRDPRSVEALFDLMQKAGPRGVAGNGPHMHNFRVALMVLTGTDQGTSRDLWVRWWNDHKQDYVLPERVPELPKPMQMGWDYYWGLEPRYEQRERREDRGQDPERRRGDGE